MTAGVWRGRVTLIATLGIRRSLLAVRAESSRADILAIGHVVITDVQLGRRLPHRQD
jgi:hypothetical protein